MVENYPNLKSNENFLRLQDELAGTENRIAVERRKYNETVQKYNTDIELFPNNLVAGSRGFERNDAYFKTEPARARDPKVEVLRNPLLHPQLHQWRLGQRPDVLRTAIPRTPRSSACTARARPSIMDNAATPLSRPSRGGA